MRDRDRRDEAADPKSDPLIPPDTLAEPLADPLPEHDTDGADVADDVNDVLRRAAYSRFDSADRPSASSMCENDEIEPRSSDDVVSNNPSSVLVAASETSLRCALQTTSDQGEPVGELAA